MNKNRLISPVSHLRGRSGRKNSPGKSNRALPKIARVNGFHFWIVALLIFILPLAREWRSIIYGDRVEGEVIEIKKITTGQNALFGGIEFRSLIGYSYQGNSKILEGPENLKYPIGKKLPLIIHPTDPEEVIIANFSGFYIQNRSIVLIVVFVLWLGIYSTLRELQRKGRRKV